MIATATAAFILTSILVCTSAGVIPVPGQNGASDLFEDVVPAQKLKPVGAVINELKALEKWRQNELKKAQEDPLLTANPKMARYLAALVEYDTRMFVFAVRLLDSLCTLDHPDDKSPDEMEQATNMVLDFKHNQEAYHISITDIKYRVDDLKEEVPDKLLETPQMETVTAAFQLTYLKIFEAFKMLELEAQSSQSPYSRDYVGSELLRVLYTANSN
nr:PREDICTED: uncharacterized protein LOC109029886 [Bemisia tabaci]